MPKEIWTDETVEFLKENYPDKGSKYCQIALGFTDKQIRTKLESLKVKRVIKRERPGYKTCPACKTEKLFQEFNKSKNEKFALNPKCKICQSNYSKKRYYVDLEASRKKVREQQGRRKEKNRLYAIKTKDRKNELRRLWRLKNRERDLKISNEYQKKRYRFRYKTDLNFKLKYLIRSIARRALKGQLKPVKSMDLLGCGIEEFKKYLESKFVSGMTWTNYGKYGWHVDHILPICSFRNLTDPSELRRCCHYTNLQPLWAKDNFNKGSKF